MKNTKEVLLKAYKEGKIIQSNSSGEWTDFEPQNQVDYPNFDYGGIDNWRIKPENETLEEAANNFSAQFLSEEDENSPFESQAALLGFQSGAKWQAEKMYTRADMCMFAGYCAGAKMTNPAADVGKILEDYNNSFKLK